MYLSKYFGKDRGSLRDSYQKTLNYSICMTKFLANIYDTLHQPLTCTKYFLR